MSSDDILAFGQQYARIIRERNFNIGVCREEIMILTVKDAPTGVLWGASSNSQNPDFVYKPVSSTDNE